MDAGQTEDGAKDITELYRATIHPLYEFVSRRAGGSRQLAEDITQETYLRAVGQWRGVGRPENALAWLQTVARNLLLNHYRRKDPSSLASVRWDAGQEASPVSDPDATALVCWGLARLGARPRLLLESFYIDGKTTRMIAADMGVSERAVEGRLRRARQALKARLEPLMRDNGEPS